MILKQGHNYRAMPHDGKTIWRIYRGGRCYYKDSPYSLAATQALKAAFPQYWTAIRDYGYAHPQLVPFVNEDPMLIVSLVEVGKTRWLVGDGLAYVDTDLLPLKDEMVELKYMQVKEQPSGGGYSIFGCRVSGSYYTLQQTGSTIRTAVGTSWIITNIVTELNKEVTIARCNNNVYENGEQIYSSTAAFNPPTLPMYLFTMNSYGTPEQFDSELLIGEAKFGERATLLPFTRNGENGMLDILSGTFHPNANTEGSFTIAITDKE